jgi:uncharacterized protein (DUF433 family)
MMNIGVSMIVNNRIAGTRITVWDVLHYLESGWSQPDIASALHLSEAQVGAALEYIDAHRDGVMKVHQQIEARKARGNPPDIRAKVAKSRVRLQDWLKQQRESNA